MIVARPSERPSYPLHLTARGTGGPVEAARHTLEQLPGSRGFARDLEAAIVWLGSRGVRVENTRFDLGLREIHDILSTPDAPDDPKCLRVLEALESGGELIEVHRGLGGVDSKEFRDRLKRFVKGTYFQREERPASSSNRARNTGFELFFGARLAQAKFGVCLPAGRDLEVPMPLIRIECKRPQNHRGVEGALKDARDQLLDHDSSCPAINMIALSVGKVLHRGTHCVLLRDPEGAQVEFSRLIDGFVEQHQNTWREESFQHVAGIWLSYSGTAVFANPKALVRATFDRIVVRPQAGAPEREAVLQIIGQGLNPLMGLRAFLPSAR